MEKLATAFNFETISLKNDYEGECVATFIAAKSNTKQRPAILYLHGFTDYFFQNHVMEAFDKNGYDFYALDLRKYGRSKLAHQHPCFCKNITEYFEELTFAINRINSNSDKKLFLMAHSTGCITVCSYLNFGKAKDSINGLILNAPFLKFNLPINKLIPLKLVATLVSKFKPFAMVHPKNPSAYVKSIHKKYEGEWDFDLKHKPVNGFPIYFSWIKAILNAQKYLKSSSKIKVPILILHSSISKHFRDSKKLHQKSDIVLNVEDMKNYGPKLGNDVTLVEVKDGLHDIFLSNQVALKFAFDQTFNWLNDTF